MSNEVVRILITESDHEAIDDINEAFSIYLPSFELETTNSGRQCINTVQNGACLDAVVLGLDLTDISGFDVIEEVRKHSELPIIVVSYIKDAPVIAQALEIGADEYITKPICQREFIARIKAVLQRI